MTCLKICWSLSQPIQLTIRILAGIARTSHHQTDKGTYRGRPDTCHGHIRATLTHKVHRQAFHQNAHGNLTCINASATLRESRYIEDQIKSKSKMNHPYPSHTLFYPGRTGSKLAATQPQSAPSTHSSRSVAAPPARWHIAPRD